METSIDLIATVGDAPVAATRIVSARFVLPIVAPPIGEGAVALAADGTVCAVGPRAEILRLFPGLSEERAEGAVLPGLVNAHTHLELSALAGAVPGQATESDGLPAWTGRLAARLGEITPAAVDAAAERAVAHAKAAGTAAIADVGNGTAGWRALAGAGMPGIFFHELVGSREARTGDALADAAAERARAAATMPATAAVPAVPAAHALYSVGPALLRRIFAAAADLGRPTTIHLAEGPDELALLREGQGAWIAVLRALGANPAERISGLGPAATLARLGAFADHAHPPLLVHMVEASAEDRRLAASAGATAVLCARSNLHIGGRLPDVPALVADRLGLAIGTDSLASAPDLSVWGELAVLAARFPAVPPQIWLRAATSGGAHALGLPALGALGPGRRPGILDASLSDDATPLRDVTRALCQSPPERLRWVASA